MYAEQHNIITDNTMLIIHSIIFFLLSKRVMYFRLELIKSITVRTDVADCHQIYCVARAINTLKLFNLSVN